MKAAVRRKYGTPEVLSIEEMAQPIPANNEVLVRVYAATVNRTDLGVLTGLPYLFRFFTGLFRPASAVPGTDFAGKIESVGSEVADYKVGDRVFGFNDNGRFGSQAEYMTTTTEQIGLIPEGINYSEAVASLEGAHYALNFINKVKLNPGDSVLLNGATGAIGSAAVQLLHNKGVRVVAVCPGEYMETVRAMGAEKVIDYTREDFTQIKEKFPFVFDAVGKSSFGKCKPLLEEKGIYISSELGPRNENPFLAMIGSFTGGKKVVFPFPVDIKGSITTMQQLLTEGKFHPLIDRTYPLELIVEAYHYVSTGQKIGNVIIDLSDERKN